MEVCILYSKSPLMITKFTPILFLSCALLLLSGCGLGDAKKIAEKQTAQYHSFLKSQNASAMMNMIHEDAKRKGTKEWENLFEAVQTFGPVQKIEPELGFHSNVENGVHSVTLKYTVTFEKRAVLETIVWQDSDDGMMKIIGLHYEN